MQAAESLVYSHVWMQSTEIQGADVGKAQIFAGTATALVTPFRDDETIDAARLRQLIERQIDAGIEGLVLAGSTGEAATLSRAEKLEIFNTALEVVNGRVPVIAGTGSNNTNATIGLTKAAAEAGVDAALVVGPFYNRPTQEGYYEHFSRIAASVPDLPVILYNVPSRTAGMIEAETQLRLAQDCPNIVATKEASGDLAVAMEIVRNAPDGFALYAGDDILTQAMISCGAAGVIAVMSNVLPRHFGEAVRRSLDGDFAGGRAAFLRLLPILQLAGAETNPIPVKNMLAQMGLIEENIRLPLTRAQTDTHAAIRAELQTLGLL